MAQRRQKVLTDYLGRKVRFTAERRRYILEHPEMAGWVGQIPAVQLLRRRSSVLVRIQKQSYSMSGN